MMRTFHMVRTEDISGNTGTGIVAEGVVLSNGKAVVSFFPTPQMPVSNVIVFDSVYEAERVHSHGGRTRIVYGTEALDVISCS